MSKTAFPFCSLLAIISGDESPPENATPALSGSQLRRRLKLSQELCQIGQFLSSILNSAVGAGYNSCLPENPPPISDQPEIHNF